MLKKSALTVMLAMCVSSGVPALALAQPGGHREGYGHGGGMQHRGDDRGHGRGHQERDDRREDRQDDRREAGPQHRFQKGERLPEEYRHRHYTVENWREHRLSAPPRGYHWVQVGGEYVLVSNSSNIILQISIGG